MTKTAKEKAMNWLDKKRAKYGGMVNRPLFAKAIDIAIRERDKYWIKTLKECMDKPTAKQVLRNIGGVFEKFGVEDND